MPTYQKRIQNTVLYCISMLLISLPSAANSQLDSQSLFDCLPTATVDNAQSYVGKEDINKSANLRTTKAGFFAQGTPINLSGTILDETCQVISGALVEIWHADAQGRTGEEADKHFAQSGKTYTNNTGAYSFKTILPESTDKNQAPYVNFLVSHPDYSSLKTIMFFPGHYKNQKDAIFVGISNDKSVAIPAAKRTAENTFVFDISIKGTAIYRDF